MKQVNSLHSYVGTVVSLNISHTMSVIPCNNENVSFIPFLEHVHNGEEAGNFLHENSRNLILPTFLFASSSIMSCLDNSTMKWRLPQAYPVR